MKTKNLILGASAIVFAVGSAFATIDGAAVNAYLKVLYQGETQPRCIQVGTCDNLSANTCTVTVTDLGQQFSVRPIDCPVQTIKHSSGSIGSYNDSGTIIQVFSN